MLNYNYETHAYARKSQKYFNTDCASQNETDILVKYEIV